MIFHQPVLLEKCIEVLKPNPNKTFLDATLGHGGHSLPLLQAGSIVYGLDMDPDNLNIATKRIQNLNLATKFTPIRENFKNIDKIFPKYIIHQLDGIIFDLGLSQNQITSDNRGFSFNDPFSLDMRLDPKKQKITAEYIINTYPENMLFDMFSKLSQEKFSRPLSQYIIRNRQKKPITTGKELGDLIRNFYHQRKLKSRIDPATKIFMALRIVVNQEYENLKAALSSSLKVTKTAGTVAVITFHSGEDRLVKSFINANHLDSQRFLPSPEDIKKNPLTRSAVLRSYTIN